MIEWFEESIDFLNYGNPRQELRTAIAKTDEVKKLVLDMIREMDLYIEDFRIEEKEENFMEVYAKHTVSGYSTELTLSEESSGTRKLFGLLPFIARSLVVGTTLVIDELDAKFVAKGKEQNSKLYSLVEFKDTKGKSVRMDAKYDKQYLEGKYGADPYLKKIIDWSDVNA